ncbi:hypothetical protein XCR_0126 [Xanthomonas campestris pv. raphani 756C]|nr:hypothetical protein XCR_0126 [Xanthomonas campestris pv. raphani 756C]
MKGGGEERCARATVCTVEKGRICKAGGAGALQRVSRRLHRLAEPSLGQ